MSTIEKHNQEKPLYELENSELLDQLKFMTNEIFALGNRFLFFYHTKVDLKFIDSNEMIEGRGTYAFSDGVTGKRDRWGRKIVKIRWCLEDFANYVKSKKLNKEDVFNIMSITYGHELGHALIDIYKGKQIYPGLAEEICDFIAGIFRGYLEKNKKINFSRSNSDLKFFTEHGGFRDEKFMNRGVHPHSKTRVQMYLDGLNMFRARGIRSSVKTALEKSTVSLL